MPRTFAARFHSSAHKQWCGLEVANQTHAPLGWVALPYPTPGPWCSLVWGRCSPLFGPLPTAGGWGGVGWSEWVGGRVDGLVGGRVDGWLGGWVDGTGGWCGGRGVGRRLVAAPEGVGLARRPPLDSKPHTLPAVPLPPCTPDSLQLHLPVRADTCRFKADQGHPGTQAGERRHTRHPGTDATKHPEAGPRCSCCRRCRRRRCCRRSCCSCQTWRSTAELLLLSYACPAAPPTPTSCIWMQPVAFAGSHHACRLRQLAVPWHAGA